MLAVDGQGCSFSVRLIAGAIWLANAMASLRSSWLNAPEFLLIACNTPITAPLTRSGTAIMSRVVNPSSLSVNLKKRSSA